MIKAIELAISTYTVQDYVLDGVVFHIVPFEGGRYRIFAGGKIN